MSKFILDSNQMELVEKNLEGVCYFIDDITSWMDDDGCMDCDGTCQGDCGNSCRGGCMGNGTNGRGD